MKEGKFSRRDVLYILLVDHTYDAVPCVKIDSCIEFHARPPFVFGVDDLLKAPIIIPP
jgi:hypothetical protein